MSRSSQKNQSPDSVMQAARTGVHTIADAGTDVYNAAVTQTRQAGRQIDQYVRSNAWYAIGIAAGVGLLMGLWLRRR